MDLNKFHLPIPALTPRPLRIRQGRDLTRDHLRLKCFVKNIAIVEFLVVMLENIIEWVQFKFVLREEATRGVL